MVPRLLERRGREASRNFNLRCHGRFVWVACRVCRLNKKHLAIIGIQHISIPLVDMILLCEWTLYIYFQITSNL